MRPECISQIWVDTTGFSVILGLEDLKNDDIELKHWWDEAMAEIRHG